MRLISNVQCGTWKHTSFSLFSPMICWFKINQWIKGACFQQGNFSRFHTSFHQCFFQKIIKRVRITGNVANHNHSLMMKVGPLLGPFFLLEQIRTPSLGWGRPWTWFLIGNFSQDFTKNVSEDSHWDTKKYLSPWRRGLENKNYLCLFGVDFSFQEMLKRYEILRSGLWKDSVKKKGKI